MSETLDGSISDKVWDDRTDQLSEDATVVDINDDHTAEEIIDNSGYSDKMVPFIYQDKKLAIPQRWYWGSVVQRMINHNKAHGYTGCILIGMSGSGKTTLTRTILHKLHQYGENYTIKWFNGEEMMNLDSIIDKMTVGVPHVLVMDDASYTLEDAKQSDVAKLANALTTIRHKLKSRVIIIFNIHYSKATKKFFRNQHFTFLTSVTTEELGNLKDLFQDKMPVIRQFGRKYRQMALLGHFYVPLSLYEGRAIKYKINEPFRLGVVSEITDLHFFVYPRDECDKCNPFKQDGTDENLNTVDKVVEKLSEYKGQKQMRTALSFWCTVHNVAGQGSKWLHGGHRSYWNMFDKMAAKTSIDWGQVCEKLYENAGATKALEREKNRTRKYTPRGKHTKKKMETVMDIINEGKAEENKPSTPKKPKLKDLPKDEQKGQQFPDYDSTFMPGSS